VNTTNIKTYKDYHKNIFDQQFHKHNPSLPVRSKQQEGQEYNSQYCLNKALGIAM
jgi:hypothetical protein